MLEFLKQVWPIVLSVLAICLSLSGSAHVLMSKKEGSSKVAWICVLWLSPIVGAILYGMFGINRVQRRLYWPQLQKAKPPLSDLSPLAKGRACDSPSLSPTKIPSLEHFMNRTSRFPLCNGNSIDILVNGDEAYPKMLQAISGAKKTVGLMSYIFDRDPLGKLFVQTLSDARKRGVEVCVLIDAVGSRYSFPSIFHMLRHLDIQHASFLPSLLPWHMNYVNLRNHRKLLLVDGEVAFTGGMNIRQGHVLSSHARHPVQDLHFRVKGPLVDQLTEVFAQDWLFAKGETLHSEQWQSNSNLHHGSITSRVVPDGPDEDIDALKWMVFGAIYHAKKNIRIATPYFIPDRTLLNLLMLASQSGKCVELLLPEKSNLHIVDWAMHFHLKSLMDCGCKIYWTPPPFDHSKLLIIDDDWSSIGSTNLDPRSLELNFEMNLECQDAQFSSKLLAIFEQKKAIARVATPSDFPNARTLAGLRNALAALGSPVL